jgi:hypothetical protein
MPVGWIGFSTASPPGFPTDPVAARTWVEQVVTNANGEFVELYYEVNRRNRANVLVVNLDDYRDLKAVLDVLDADEYVKLLFPDQAKDVVDNRIPNIRPAEAPAEGAVEGTEGPESESKTTT